MNSFLRQAGIVLTAGSLMVGGLATQAVANPGGTSVARSFPGYGWTPEAALEKARLAMKEESTKRNELCVERSHSTYQIRIWGGYSGTIEAECASLGSRS